MKFLTGKIAHSMDAKYRIRIPSKYKEALLEGEQSLHFVQYSSGGIAVMNDETLRRRLCCFDDVDPSDVEKVAAKRFIMSKVEDIEEDGQKRITLSKTVREYMGADKDHADLISVGMGDYLEIWVAEEYEKSIQGLSVQKAQQTLARGSDSGK